MSLKDRLIILVCVVGLAGAMEGNLEDVETWLNEALLDFIDAATVDSPRYVDGALDVDTYATWLAESRQLVAGRVPWGAQLFSWGVTAEHIDRGVAAARDAGCEELVFFESQGIQKNNRWPAVKEAVGKYGE